MTEFNHLGRFVSKLHLESYCRLYDNDKEIVLYERTYMVDMKFMSM